MLEKPGVDNHLNIALLRVWSDSDWAGKTKDPKSKSSLKIEADDCPLFCITKAPVDEGPLAAAVDRKPRGLPVQGLRQLREWNGLALDGNERRADCEK